MLSIVRAPGPPTPGALSPPPDRARLEVQALGLLAAVALQEENFVRMEAIDRERLDKVRARLPELRGELRVGGERPRHRAADER